MISKPINALPMGIKAHSASPRAREGSGGVDRVMALKSNSCCPTNRLSSADRLFRLQPYDSKKIPVLFVHGLQDTAATWMPMLNALLDDPQIRNNYQFWFFTYPSGYPFPYSAALLRH